MHYYHIHFYVSLMMKKCFCKCSSKGILKNSKKIELVCTSLNYDNNFLKKHSFYLFTDVQKKKLLYPLTVLIKKIAMQRYEMNMVFYHRFKKCKKFRPGTATLIDKIRSLSVSRSEILLQILFFSVRSYNILWLAHTDLSFKRMF